MSQITLNKFNDLHNSQLRVNDKRPARRVGEYGGVLCTHCISGQALVVPTGYLRIVRQHRQGLQAFRHFYFRLKDKEIIRDFDFYIFVTFVFVHTSYRIIIFRLNLMVLSSKGDFGTQARQINIGTGDTLHPIEYLHHNLSKPFI